MYLVRGRLDPEVGAMLMRALEAAGDALFRKETAEEIEPMHRRADAMGLLAERALAVGFGDGAGAAGEEAEAAEAAKAVEDVEDVEDVEPAEAAEDVEPEAADREEARPTPLSGSRAERYQVVLYVDPPTLEREKHTKREGGPRGSGPGERSPGNNSEPGRSELEDGTRVSAETSRRLSCDASVVRITEAPDLSAPRGRRVLDVDAPHGRGVPDVASPHGRRVLDVGRKARTIPPSLRRALESRDRGCRFPGCGLRFTDAHHIEHWADGGETKLRNLVLLCRFHHRLVHEEGYTVHFPHGERFYFLNPRMRLIPDRPPATGPASPGLSPW